MIEQLRIRDLGVIADATLELGPGFTAITGETGAGKTMVVTALGLLMGARSDAGAVRSGAAAARVGGLVQTRDPQVTQLVESAGGDLEDSTLTLTRTVSSEGRSRVSIGGSVAPVGTLTKIADHLFAVHGQSEQLRLRNATAQRNMLDRFGGPALLTVLTEYQRVHAQRRDTETQLSHLRGQREARLEEAAKLREQLEHIDAADPQPGEDMALRQRIERLSKLEQLRAGSAAALAAITSDSEGTFSEATAPADAGTLLDRALRELEQLTAADDRLDPLIETLRELSFQLSDLGRELALYLSDIDQTGPDELQQAHERLAQLGTLSRDYGGDLEAVIAHGVVAAARLGELDGDDERIETLTIEHQQLDAGERKLAEQLSQLRSDAAARLSEAVTAELHQLALPDARFLVEIETGERGSFGADTVRLMLQPHPGASPRPLAKGASGGELSRVMLALEVVVAASDPVPTFVFDEVDSGVGGAAAIEIGRRLARLARSSQVIVVTHLAQVAAFADNHLVVVKDSAGGFTESSCRRVNGARRLAEMARLLSGLTDSESALAHAAELLELGSDSTAGAEGG